MNLNVRTRKKSIIWEGKPVSLEDDVFSAICIYFTMYFDDRNNGKKPL